MKGAGSLVVATVLVALCACNSSSDKEARAKQAQQLDVLQKQVTSLHTEVTGLRTEVTSLRTELSKWRDLLTKPYITKDISIEMPKAAAKPASVDPKLVVNITRDGKVFVAGKAVAEADLDKTFAAVVAHDKDTQMVISADNHVPYRRVITVMDRAKRAGVRRIAIEVPSNPGRPSKNPR